MILPFVGCQQGIRINVLHTYKDFIDTRLHRFFNEIRNAMAEHIDLDQEPQSDTVIFPQRNHAVEESIPVFVAGKIVVGNEEPIDTQIVIRADYFL